MYHMQKLAKAEESTSGTKKSPYDTLDLKNKGFLSRLLRDGRERLEVGAVGFTTGLVLTGVGIAFHNTELLEFVGFLFAAGAFYTSQGISRLRKARRLEKGIQEKPQKEALDIKRHA